MEIIHSQGFELVALTYEEEQSIAKSVMDCISLRWVAGGFQTALNNIYMAKCKYGSLVQVDDLIHLMWYYDRYDIEHPEINDDGKTINDDLDIANFKNWDDLKDEARSTVIRAWREVWDAHTTIKGIAGAYSAFPGDESRSYHNELGMASNDEQMALDRYFWDEVDRVIDEYECSRSDAIIMVSDYVPRGDFTTL